MTGEKSPVTRRTAGVCFAAVLTTALLMCVIVSADTGTGDPCEPGEVTGMKDSKEKAVYWLKKQVVPNEAVPRPALSRIGFVLSYAVDKTGVNGDNLYGKSNLYDNAITAIALTMAGDLKTAESVLTSVIKNRNSNNDLWFTYNTADEWPCDRNNHGAVIRSGASAWFGYAVVFYLEWLKSAGTDIEKSRAFRVLLHEAELVCEAMLKRQVRDRCDKRYRLVTGGDNSYRLVYDESNNLAREVFETGTVEWVSTEHNCDLYFFLQGLYRLTGKGHYKTAAEETARGLVSGWSDSISQMGRGRDRESADSTESLDCASWGSIFLRSAGHAEKAGISLETCSGYALEYEGQRGYRPYRNMLVYEGSFINSKMYPDKPLMNWNDMPMLWHEGSLGVAMAFIKAGRMEEAKAVIDSVIAFQNPGGGIPYSSLSVPFQFTTDESVASAAWLVMAISAYENPGVRELFWK